MLRDNYGMFKRLKALKYELHWEHFVRETDFVRLLTANIYTHLHARNFPETNLRGISIQI